jgi:hypothetical protein
LRVEREGCQCNEPSQYARHGHEYGAKGGATERAAERWRGSLRHPFDLTEVAFVLDCAPCAENVGSAAVARSNREIAPFVGCC